MAKSDPLEILLAHDQWATRQILEACSRLTSEQFHQRFDIGPGSLHDTNRHILGAIQTWIYTLRQMELGPRVDQDSERRTPVELLSLLESITSELSAEAHRLPLNEIVSRTREGKTYQFTRAAVLMHVLTHGTHHRAQCLNMLRHLGVKPLPPSSVAEWSRMVDSAS
jgi:uncharacterized damage-inducible protein DinB